MSPLHRVRKRVPHETCCCFLRVRNECWSVSAAARTASSSCCSPVGWRSRRAPFAPRVSVPASSAACGIIPNKSLRLPMSQFQLLSTVSCKRLKIQTMDECPLIQAQNNSREFPFTEKKWRIRYVRENYSWCTEMLGSLMHVYKRLWVPA